VLLPCHRSDWFLQFRAIACIRAQLEEENAKLKRIVADQALDIAMLKDLAGKNVWFGSSGQEQGLSSAIIRSEDHAASAHRYS